MSSIQNDRRAKIKAKNALVLNKVKPDVTCVPKTCANRKIQPKQKTQG
jgi:hypothetical protein